jgi:signal peptidase II
MRGLSLTVFLTLLVDQASKYWVVQVLNLKGLGNIEVLPPLLNFRMAWNRGVNFGLFSDGGDGGRWFLIALALAITVGVLIWVRRETDTRVHLASGLLVGGALGNVIDRLVYGAVADFLNMSCCGIANPFAFNVADVAIFAGAIGLVLFTGRESRA